MILLWCTFLLLLFILFKYHWQRRDLYRAALQYNGELALPLIGNALTFSCSNVEILHRVYEMILKYSNPIRFWLGPYLVLIFKDPNQVEKILSSPKFAHKHEMYDLLKCIMGDGLVTGSGPKYKVHRRLIQPMISMKFCENSMDTICRHIDTCVNNLTPFQVSGAMFDIHHVIHKSVVGIIGDIVMGHKFNFKEPDDKAYVQAAIDMYDHGFTRLVRPWIQPDIIHQFTDHKKIERTLQAIIRPFTENIVTDSWKRRKLIKNNHAQPTPIIDQIGEQLEKNPGVMDSQDYVSHMITLYAASEDTLTIISSFVCVCLGMYPEYQKRVAEEIYDVFGKTPRKVTLDDINKLTYLDMCIKDVLRLIPIAPYIMRRNLEDQYIDAFYVPKGVAIMIPIYNLHRDPRYWENPFHFHPDHFLPEAVQKRPVYAYVPFSAGPRSCVGKTLAKVGLKVILATLLQNFEFEADGKFPDLKIRMDISVRPVYGYNVRLKKRVWN